MPATSRELRSPLTNEYLGLAVQETEVGPWTWIDPRSGIKLSKGSLASLAELVDSFLRQRKEEHIRLRTFRPRHTAVRVRRGWRRQ